MNIQLSDHFTYWKLIRFTLPSVFMMVFSSIYGVVDGFFVSNMAGSLPFASISLVMPFLQIFGAFGFMIGTGGSALVSMKLGQGMKEEANRTFSLLIYTLIVIGLSLTVFGIIFLEPIAYALGANEDMIGYCMSYGTIILISLTPFMLQNAFQSFMVAAGRPNLGLAVTIIAGVANMVLDAALMGPLKMGVTGAALATAISQSLGGFIPLIFFLLPNKSSLRLGKTTFDPGSIGKASVNGSSEFLSNISLSIVSMLYNYQLMRIAGADGVAAYGVIMYINFIFLGVFLGYSMGSSPIVSYHYGAGNTKELQNLLSRSLKLVGVLSVVLTALAELFARPLSMIFVSYDQNLLDMTTYGFRLYSIAFLVAGFSLYGSSFFTALNDGKISALISFGRTLVFQVLSVLILPVFLGLNGIWLSEVAAEVLALFLTVICLVKYKDKYHYFKERKHMNRKMKNAGEVSI